MRLRFRSFGFRICLGFIAKAYSTDIVEEAQIRTAVGGHGYLTAKLTPQSFAPEKTVVVPPGTGGAHIALQHSSTLIDWAEATNCVYSNLSVAEFFHIRAGPPLEYVPTFAVTSPQTEKAARVVTLMPYLGPPGSQSDEELLINRFQTAELVAWGGGQAGPFPYLQLDSRLLEAELSPFVIGTAFSCRAIVAGPAKIGIGTGNYCTVKVTSEQYPPDRTLVLPPGTKSTLVVLQGSTHLIDWSTATNGLYTGLPTAMFFRIMAERVP